MTDRSADIQNLSEAASDGAGGAKLLAGRARGLIRQALMARFSAFLKPGESLEIDAELADEYVWAIIRLVSADESFQLDVEASILAADQGARQLEEAEKYLEMVIEFLKLQLYDYFRQDRDERFHIDWRIYQVQQFNVRFRGQIRQPTLEEQADALLDQAGGGPGPQLVRSDEEDPG